MASTETNGTDARIAPTSELVKQTPGFATIKMVMTAILRHSKSIYLPGGLLSYFNNGRCSGLRRRRDTEEWLITNGFFALLFFGRVLMPKLHQEQQVVSDLQHPADEQRP